MIIIIIIIFKFWKKKKIKKKIKDLKNTVGIHPTIAEEFTTMAILKSTGQNFQKSGCWG
jgi:hypothetical protein